MTDSEKKIYNQAITDVINCAKNYGLISSDLGLSDIMAYENKTISEDELWERFEENAIGELNMAVLDLWQKVN